MAKLTWSDDGLSTRDGRYVMAAVHDGNGQTGTYYWAECPLLEYSETEDAETYPGVTVRRREVVKDRRPYGCDSVDEMQEQAQAIEDGGRALRAFEAPRQAARDAQLAERRQARDDAAMDALVDKVLGRLAQRDEG